MVIIDFLFEKTKYSLPLIILVLILHLFLGKPRWQYYPIYLLLAFYFVLALGNKFNLLKINPNQSKLIIAVGLILFSSSLIFLLVFPIYKLPRPTGKFSVGTRIYELEDKSRNEIYSDIEGDKRKIKYQIWYPSESVQGFNKAKWISDGVLLTRQLAKSMKFPFFILDHTEKIYSNSYLNAPISNNKVTYPLVIISHGWKGFRELHTDYAEDLASNGFIAVSIDHSYGSQFVSFKDGTKAYLNKDALPSGVNPSEYNKSSNRLVSTYGEDVSAVLDDLEIHNSYSEEFRNKLDLDKVGLLGHSTGGGGHVYIGEKDKRIKAILGFDPWVKPIEAGNLKKDLSIPSLFIRSEQWALGPNNINLKKIMDSWEKANLVQMKKTNHVDFSMSYMYSPLSRYVGFTGKLPGRTSSEIQRDFIIEFFSANLKDKENNSEDYLKKIVNKYAAVEFVDMD